MKEYGFTITNAGRDLLTKILAGSQLTITKVMVGNGKLSGQDPVALTDLVSPKHPATATVPKVTDGTVTFTIQYQNQETGMVTINEYGVFAQDPDAGEILLYYATLGDYPQYVMPGQGDIRRFPVSIALSANDVEVNLAFDSSAFISAKDLDTKVSKSGDTMTGDLMLLSTTPTKSYQAVHKKYVDDNAGGKRTCRFVVGTSTAGWTSKDCDYLCDGTDDQVEIQAAINALPSAGGEVVVLDGTYNINPTITISKPNVKLTGNGKSTILKRKGTGNMIDVSGVYCTISCLQIDGNKTNYSDRSSNCINLRGTYGTVENIVCKNNSYNVISLVLSNNFIIGNIFENIGNIGISVATDSNNNTISSNYFINNDSYAISVGSSSNNVVTKNYIQGKEGISIHGNYNNISNNIIKSEGNICITMTSQHSCVSNNLCIGGKNHGISASKYNTVTGNVCIASTTTGNSVGISLPGGFVSCCGNYCKGYDKGIQTSSYDNLISGNICSESKVCGIDLSNYRNCVVGNVVKKSTSYTSEQYSIYLGSNTAYSLVANNLIYGKNYVNNGGSSNTFVNNKYN